MTVRERKRNREMPTKRMKDADSQEEIHIPILEWKEREIEEGI